MLKLRDTDVKTVMERNPNWWGKLQGNVSEVTYLSIRSDATRVSALISGNVDLIIDPPPQDVARLHKQGKIRVIEGEENRVIFFGFDQARDELLYSDVKGKNPVNHRLGRQARHPAIHINARHPAHAARLH